MEALGFVGPHFLILSTRSAPSGSSARTPTPRGPRVTPSHIYRHRRLIPSPGEGTVAECVEGAAGFLVIETGEQVAEDVEDIEEEL